MSTERENGHSDGKSGERSAPYAHAGVRAGPAGGFLIFAGAILLLAGTAMLVVPRVSPSYAGIVRTLEGYGLTSMPLLGAGILFTGLWLTVRTSREHSIAAQVAALSAGPAIASLSEKLTDLRDGLQGLRIEFVYLKEAIQTEFERQSQTANTDSSAEGIYRLAASLDQLGLRIEQRLVSSEIEMRERLDSLASTIEVAQREGRDGRIHLSDDSVPAGDQEADAYSPRERLGVLDMLDDLGRLLPKKAPLASGTPMITSDAFEGVQDEGWGRHAGPAAPLPSTLSLAASDLGRAGALLAGDDIHEPTDDLAMIRKLEELRALLADSRVRDALTAMERVES
ncbi:MAG: hypothetical protein ACKVXR_11360 [Planctomycetota bacterium]